MVKRVTGFYFVVLGAVFLLGAKTEDRKLGVEYGKPEIIGIPVKAVPEDYKLVLAEAEPIIGNILAAMNEKSYECYVRDFSAAMRAGYTKDVFKKNSAMLKEKIGTYGSRKLWKIEKSSQNYILYYNTKFSKIREPVVIRLVLQRTKSQLRVTFLSFDSPVLKDIGQKKGNAGGDSGGINKD
jgi:hypothetical protein